MTGSPWPTREQWAAAAEHAVRTACYAIERVPEGAEHYLTGDEFAERDRLYVALSTAVRRPLTAEIKRLSSLLPSPPPDHPLVRNSWYRNLLPQQQAIWQQIGALRTARLDIGRRAKGQPYGLMHYSVLSPEVGPFVADAEGLDRLAALEAKYLRLRKQAAQEALDAAIAAAVAERNSDEGWAKELRRRARIDDGPTINATVHWPEGDHRG